MAIKQCPDCNGNASDTVTTCPHCGRSMTFGRQGLEPVNKKSEILVLEAAGALLVSALSAYAGAVMLVAMSVSGSGRVQAIAGITVNHDNLPLLAISAFVVAAVFMAFGIKNIKKLNNLRSHNKMNSSVPPKDASERYKWANRLPPYDKMNSSVPPEDASERYKWANRLPPYDD